FFGMAFSVPSGRTDDFTGDGAVYRELFDQYKYVSHSDFIEGWREFLTFDEGKKDYYFETVAFYISLITNNYHAMFMVIAIVFAFFALKSFRFLISEPNFTISVAC